MFTCSEGIFLSVKPTKTDHQRHNSERISFHLMSSRRGVARREVCGYKWDNASRDRDNRHTHSVMKRHNGVWSFIRQDSLFNVKKKSPMEEIRRKHNSLLASPEIEALTADLGKGLLSELECPVCMEYMKPPITFCENGHNICSKCKPKLLNCPTCRESFVNIRNVALEKLARQMKYPCSYRKYGCKETFPPNLISQHQAKCRYTPQACPLDRLRKVDCDWIGSTGEVKKHLKECHKEQCLEYNGRHTLILQGIKASCGFFRLIFAHNEIFYRHFQIKDGNFYGVLQYIGPTENVSKFRYKLIFVNDKSTECITMTQEARSISENLDDLFRSGNCVKLHYDVVSRFMTENNDLLIGMAIYKVSSLSVSS